MNLKTKRNLLSFKLFKTNRTQTNTKIKAKLTTQLKDLVLIKLMSKPAIALTRVPTLRIMALLWIINLKKDFNTF